MNALCVSLFRTVLRQHLLLNQCWGNHNALVNSLDLTHLQVSKENLLLLVVNIPYTKAIVVDGHKLLVGVVIECNLVRNIHTNGVSTDSFSTSNLI